MGIGTALNRSSRVWFTISHGILNEVYFPRVDMACTRDMGLIVTNGVNFFSEEKRDCTFEIVPAEPGVPAFRLVNSHFGGRYRIEKEVFADPHRNVLLQKIRLVPLAGALSDYRLYVLLAPHLGNVGSNNTAWIGDYKGVPMLYAEGPTGLALALGCSAPWKNMSVGFAGVSDGWRELSRNFQLKDFYQRAENGNVALTAEIDLDACKGECVLGIGFGFIWAEAGELVRAAQFDEYESLSRDYVSQWHAWHKGLMKLDRANAEHDLYRASVAVLRSHESKDFLGGVIASLSIPWGFNKGDEDLGGYHLVWPRDLVETAGGVLAAGTG